MKPIAITQGDIAGIGPEIIAKAFMSETDLMLGCFVAGDVCVMRAAFAANGADKVRDACVVQIEHPDQASTVVWPSMPVMQIGSPVESVAVGGISAVAGEFAGRSVLWAANAALRGVIGALVTAPLHKESLHAAGLPYSQYPGHTEMLQAVCADYLGKDISELPVKMMLANEELRTVLVSIHTSLRKAIDAVTLSNVLETIQITHLALTHMLGRSPRILVAGLNPHAGEGGLFGSEELEVIAPAVEMARRGGIDATGPLPPDTVFMQARRSRFTANPVDVVIAMYHDQGLIPVKYLGVEKGVNVTLGLPIIRTSPDHGTAMDIAGKGLADPSSLLEAVRMAKSAIIF